MSSAGYGVVVAGAGVLAVGAAVVGAGILVARGVMWCGEKLEEHYQRTCQEWSDLANASRAESRANVQELNVYLNAQLEFLSISEYASAPQNTQATVSQRELDRAISQARAALVDNTRISVNKDEAERKILVSRLRAEIKAGRGTLPPTIIAEGETALRGTTTELNAMLKCFDDAWHTLSDISAQQTHRVQQTEQLLTQLSARLRMIDSIMRDSGATRNLDYQRRLRDLESRAIEVRDDLKADPRQAYAQATRTQQEADTLLSEVASYAHQAWHTLHINVNRQIGTLRALSLMLQEAEAIQLIEPQHLASLKQRVATLQQKAELLMQGASKQMQSDFTRLSSGVELLRQEVFARVKGGQQRTIATLIQTTLSELGFLSEMGNPPRITVNGEITRVEVMASRASTGDEREDRLITFDISRDGRVSYDLAGYVGNTCLADANKIFDALREKGVYLMNEQALDDLHRLPADNLIAEIMQQDRFKLALKQNKTQAEMAETLKGILEQMGYPTVRTSSVGGSIEVEAFTGNTGYRIILSPDGDRQVLKDASQVDVTEDQQDKVAAASRIVQEQSQEPAINERKRSFMTSRKGRMLSH